MLEAVEVGQDRVLLVDDEDEVRRVLQRILERNGYDCDCASSVAAAREMLQENDYALVISDMNMPGESGLELVRLVVSEYPETATIMCTAMDDRDTAQTAIRTGAYGYIVKPFEPNQILIAAMNALRRRELEIENRLHRENLEEMVRNRTSDLWRAVTHLEQVERDLRSSREETIQRLSIAAEYKDPETAAHLRRMSLYCSLLAERLGFEGPRCESVRLASVMHDVGKIGIPDNILLKPGPLTPDEWVVMKQHTEIGYRILANAGSELLDLAAQIALTHHERLDGSGYPQGLFEDDIPVEGKITAVADMFDALTTNRVYREAYSLADALEVMREERGDHLDPKILDLFIDSMDRVLGIRELHMDLDQTAIAH